MEPIRDTIEVEANIEACYDAWRKFENFPRFMANVKSVQKLSERDSLWVSEVVGVEHRWQATVTEDQRPRRIAWKAGGDVGMDGMVTFSQVRPGATRIDVEFLWHGGGITGAVAEALKIDEAVVKRNLHNFKDFIEGRRVEATPGTTGGAYGGGPSGTPPPSGRY